MLSVFKKVFMSLVIAAAVVIVGPLAYAANTIIDVLVVYTQGTADMYGGDPTSRFNQLFQVSNQIYRDSGVDLELRLAKIKLVDYTDDNEAGFALNDITFEKVAAFKGVAALRDQSKADMVILYRPYKAVHGTCGLAWIGGSAESNLSNPDWKKYMYAHIAINSCGDYVTAHELGHNMGLKHSRRQDGSGSAFPYALGYGMDNQFTTIMAYQSSFNVDYWTGKMYKFSNPNLLCKGFPCGIDRNDTQHGADAHFALNITAPHIAKFSDSFSIIGDGTGTNNFKRTVIFIQGVTSVGQDLFIRGGIDHGHAKSTLGLDCTQQNMLCDIPIRHLNSRNATTNSWKVNDNNLDWYGAEAAQNALAQGSPLDWSTWISSNTWATMELNGFGKTPLNVWGDHYWMLDAEIDCSRTVNGWFELKSFISNGPGWEQNVTQPSAPYASNNHFAQCGKLNVFRRGENNPVTISDL